MDNDLAASMDWGVSEIKNIQKAARSGKPIVKPRWPMIVLRTPKGLSGPKMVHGEFCEGSFRSHQVPLPEAKTSREELQQLEDWLMSYNPQELFPDGRPNEKILSIIPERNEKKLGQRKESYAAYQPLLTPNWMQFGLPKGSSESCMQAIGRFLDDVVKEYVSIFTRSEILLILVQQSEDFPHLFPRRACVEQVGCRV